MASRNIFIISQNFYYLTIFLFCCVQSYVLPVEKCKLEDSGCMVSGFQKAVPIFMAGIPEANVDILDIMDMDDIKFDLSGLQFSLTEGKLKGLKDAVVDNVKWDTNKKTVDVHYHVDAQVQGHYTAGGMLLVLPISGDGDLDLKLKNLEIKLRLEYEVEKDSKGKDHIAPKKYSFQFEVKDGANFALTNLFNGNKELSDTMLTFLNDNWKQISNEFGKPLVETAAKKIFKNIAKFFKKSPIEDIALV